MCLFIKGARGLHIHGSECGRLPGGSQEVKDLLATQET